MYEISGFKDKLVVYPDRVNLPFCLNETFFWIFVLCLLGGPYRLWFKLSTHREKFIIVKLLGLKRQKEESNDAV